MWSYNYLTDYYFFKAALKRNMTPTQLKEDLIQLGILYNMCKYQWVYMYYTIGLNDNKSEWVATQWKCNLSTFSRITVGQSLNVNQLVDMEWRFGG